jgi:hypothetical protein
MGGEQESTYWRSGQELVLGLYFGSSSGESSNRQKIKVAIFRPEIADRPSTPDTALVTDLCSMVHGSSIFVSTCDCEKKM